MPAASHFSCFAEKSNQKKATRGSSPRKSAGYPSENPAWLSRSAGASHGTRNPASPRNVRPLRDSGSNWDCTRGFVCARPQTVLSDGPCRFWFGRREACFAKPLPNLSDSHRDPASPSLLSSRRRPGSKLTLFCLGPGLRREDIFFDSRSAQWSRGPMRGAEQRSKRGGRPRGLSEGEHTRNLLFASTTSPSSAAARVCEQRRAAR